MAQQLPPFRPPALSPEGAAHQALVSEIRRAGEAERAAMRQENAVPPTAPARPVQPRQVRPLPSAPEKVAMSSSGSKLGAKRTMGRADRPRHPRSSCAQNSSRCTTFVLWRRPGWLVRVGAGMRGAGL
jgi:hypothetical protein